MDYHLGSSASSLCKCRLFTTTITTTITLHPSSPSPFPPRRLAPPRSNCVPVGPVTPSLTAYRRRRRLLFLMKCCVHAARASSIPTTERGRENSIDFYSLSSRARARYGSVRISGAAGAIWMAADGVGREEGRGEDGGQSESSGLLAARHGRHVIHFTQAAAGRERAPLSAELLPLCLHQQQLQQQQRRLVKYFY